MLIVKKDPSSLVAEAYRKLRTGIEYSSVDNKLKSIVITSSMSGEGKTTVAGNLAYILSENEKKVIVIDCDLRKPTLHKQFEVSNVKGITEHIVGKETFNDVVIEITENLHIITSGKIPPNPAEVVASKTMEQLIERLKKSYDYILIDTPPIRAVTDGQVLAGKVDGVLIVVQSAKATGDSVTKTYKELKKVNAKIVGSVINLIEKDKEQRYYSNYYKKEDKKSKRKNKEVLAGE